MINVPTSEQRKLHRRASDQAQTQARSSAHERPKIRILFVTPDGEIHQSTLSSSWGGDSDLPGSMLNPAGPGAAEAIGHYIGYVKKIYVRAHCSVLSIEQISTSVMELL